MSRFPTPCRIFFSCLLVALTVGAPVILQAQSTLIPLPTRRGMVFDHTGNHLYITTSDGNVQPCNIATGQLETAYSFGASSSLNGVDIAPDDSFLLVAEANVIGGQGTFYKLDLGGGAVTNISYTPEGPQFGYTTESGAYDVAIISNGLAFATTNGGAGRFRQISLTTSTINVRADVPPSKGLENGMVAASTKINRSADRGLLFILQPSDGSQNAPSSAPILTYNAATDAFSSVPDRYLPVGVIGAANRNGTLLATQKDTGISQPSFSIETAAGLHYAHSFFGIDGGVTFDSVRDILYAAKCSAGQIIAYDSNTFAELFRLTIGEAMTPNHSAPAIGNSGTLIASQDGRYLALETPSGVRLFTIPATLPSPTPAPTPTTTLATRRDMVFDHSGQFLYVSTTAGLVERYNVALSKIDQFYDLGAPLNGIDIAPDDSFVLVAPSVTGLVEGVLYRLDLGTGNVIRFTYSIGNDEEGGAEDVAIASNGKALLTTAAGHAGGTGGVTYLHEIDLSTGEVTIRNDVPVPDAFSGSLNSYNYVAAQIHRDPDGNRLCIIDAATHVFTYDAASDSFGRGTTAGFANTGAVSRDGTLLATRISYHFSLDSAPDLTFQHAINDDGKGLAFDPKADIIYSVNNSANQIIAYDTVTFAEKFRLDVGENIAAGLYSPPAPFNIANLVVSPDGHHLAVETPTGVRVLDVSASIPTPPAAPIFEFSSDMVFNHAGTYLYISTLEGYLWPYNLATNKLETPYFLGGILNGVDIAPDDSYLLVGQDQMGVAQGTVHKLSLTGGTVTNINFERFMFLEAGSWDVAIASNGKAFFTTGLLGSGGLPLRQIDLATNAVTYRSDASQFFGAPASLYRSADGTGLVFLDSNSSAGFRFFYSAGTDTCGPLVFGAGFNDFSNFAVNRNATLFEQNGALISIPGFSQLHIFSGIEGGVAFNALSDVVYTVNPATDQILGYNTSTFAQVFTANIGEDIPSGASHFEFGKMVASPNGRYLALLTPNDVRLIDVTTGGSRPIPTPAPTPTPTPTATPVVSVSASSGSVSEGGTVTFTISATSGTIRPVNVGFSMSGKASQGSDYTLSQGSPVTIPVGQNSATVTMTTIIDHLKEKKETATMTLSSGAGYSFGGTSSGKKKPKKVKPPAATVSFIDTP